MNIQAAPLRAFVEQVGLRVGMAPQEAAIFADSLVFANLRGIDSHGVLRLHTYLARIRDGFLTPGAEPEVTRDGGSVLAVSGHNGIGSYIAASTMERCIERARETGVCISGVAHGNHFGCAAYFTRMAAKAHMIGFAMTNSPRIVAAYGGAQPLLGTNPLAVSIPAAGDLSFDLDMATSLVAQGKLLLARDEGRAVPLGWGVDAQGQDCTDPNTILTQGMLLPFGGYKGYGVALMIELLCVCLGGGAKSTEMGSMYKDARPQETGFVLGAIDYSKIVEPEIFEARARDVLQDFSASRHVQDVERVYIAGEIEEARMRQKEKDGIDISDAIWGQLKEIGQTYGVPLPD